MTALGIRYLRGYSVASDVPRQRPEWPPHPGRVFMALAATYFETGEDADERKALEWLEQENAPAIAASGCFERSFAETYVPANDSAAGIFDRTRQPRSFATVRPDNDSVFLIWSEDAPLRIQTALNRLCQKVTRVGHSSSLVQMWLADSTATPAPTWLPDESTATQKMRVPTVGTLSYLENAFSPEEIAAYNALNEAFELTKGKEKADLKSELAKRFPGGSPSPTRPSLSTWQGYAPKSLSPVTEEIIHGPFDSNLLIFSKYEGTTLGMEATLALTGTLRSVAMKRVGNDVPKWLSGHQPDGSPSREPHVAFLAFPNIDSEHADGHLMGLGMAIPRDIPDAEMRRVLGALLFSEAGEETEIKLWKDRSGEEDEKAWSWILERERRARPPQALRTDKWTASSKLWASVTPVVLHHHPKRNRANDVERIVREAFRSALFPDPVGVAIQSVSHFRGATPAMGMPLFSDKNQSLSSYQVHVKIRFEKPVTGPVLVGRGRFRGYGLFRPMEETSNGTT